LSVFLFFVPLSELILESFTYNQNEAFGARHWINDLPCWALVLTTVFQCFKGKKWSSFLIVSAVLGGVVSGCAALVYRYDFDAYYFTGSWAPALKNLKLSEAFFFFQPRESAAKLELWPLWMAALVCFFLLFFRKKNFNTGLLSLWFLNALALGYPLITVGNLLNSEKSAKAVPERIARAVIGKGIHINSFFENAGCIERSVEYYTRKGDFDTARKRQDLLEKYVARASGEILEDPIHFRETLIPGKKKYVPDELRTDE